jgi:uncharacterized protein (DUF362 family)
MSINRREFIQHMLALGLTAAAAASVFSLLNCSSQLNDVPNSDNTTPTPPPPPPGDAAYLAIARGKSPTAMVQAAIEALGGIERFVKPGNDVIIKPNICVSYRTYEYAATTNPEVVGALVALCLGAGAKRVRVMDTPFSGSADEAYPTSGIEQAVRAAGGEMEVMASMKFQNTTIPYGRKITSWPVYRDILETDVLIDVPIAKQHGLARLTLGMKNLLGVVSNPGGLHTDLPEKLADLTSLVRPHLTVVDGVRILMNNGPSGGSLSDVKLANTVIASHDIVAADAYAATLFGLDGTDIGTVRAGANRGLGTMDMTAIKIEEIPVGA